MEIVNRQSIIRNPIEKKTARAGTLGKLDIVTRNEFRFLPEMERKCLLEQAHAEKTLIGTLSEKDETVKKQLREGYGISVEVSCKSSRDEGQRSVYVAGISKETGPYFRTSSLPLKHGEYLVRREAEHMFGQYQYIPSNESYLIYHTPVTYSTKIFIKIAIPGMNNGNDILAESKNYVWQEEVSRYWSGAWHTKYDYIGEKYNSVYDIRDVKLTGMTINGNVLYGEKPRTNWKTWMNNLLQPLRKSKGSDGYNIEIGYVAIAGQAGELHTWSDVLRFTVLKENAARQSKEVGA